MSMQDSACLEFTDTAEWHRADHPPAFSREEMSARFLVVVRHSTDSPAELMIGYYTQLRDGRKVWLVADDDGHWSQDAVTHWQRLPPLPAD